MRLLLDTHIFLWYISGDKQLAISAQDAIRDPHNDVYLSVASLWEAIIKYQLGKLPLPAPPEKYLPKQREKHLISSLEIDEGSIAQLAQLPLLHRDPFDRIIIGQALQHNMVIVTVDNSIKAYSVQVL